MTTAEEKPGIGSPRKRRRRPKLTARDERILALVGEYGCVSAERIKNHFWKSTKDSRTHYRRISILRKRGLLENVVGDRAMTIGYRLTLRGKRIVARSGIARTTAINRRAYKTQFEHDQFLIDIRGVLEKSPIVREFQSEPEIRRALLTKDRRLMHWENAPSIPDGAFVLSVPGQEQRAVLELELTPKKRQRYSRIFRNHLLSKDWSLVFYVVRDENILRLLMQLLSDVKTKDAQVQVARRINGIYFCTLENFLKLELAVPFTNGKEEITFAGIARNFGIEET